MEWAWAGITTLGRWERQADNSWIPVIYIPQRYNEAEASSSFIYNITREWVTGFADYSKVPTDGNPASWQQYIKERTKVMGEVATTGAEIYLKWSFDSKRGYRLDRHSPGCRYGQNGGPSCDRLNFLPSFYFRRLYKGNKKRAYNSTSHSSSTTIGRQILQGYKLAGFGTNGFFDNMVNFKEALVLQRKDVVFNEAQVRSMMDKRAPYAFDVKAGKFDQIQLHHVDQHPESGGVVAEIFQGQNSARQLHPGNNGADNDSPAWKNSVKTIGTIGFRWESTIVGSARRLLTSFARS